MQKTTDDMIGVTETPLVSVVIPTYNRAHVIERAIRSVLNQTYYNWELIIVDDGSSDETGNLVKKYLADSRIKYYKISKSGAPYARNYGMRLSSGVLVSLLDSDDEFHPKKIETQMMAMNRGTDFSICNRIIVKDGLELPIAASSKNIFLTKKDIFSGKVGLSASLLMFRKSFSNNIEFDVSFPASQDTDFVLRMMSCTNIVFIATPLCRIHKTLAYERISTDFKGKLQGFRKLMLKAVLGEYRLAFSDVILLLLRFSKLYVAFFILDLAMKPPLVGTYVRKILNKFWG